MAFVCISIVAANLAITAWSIMSVGVEITFRDLFDSVKAGKYTIIPASEKLTRSEIEKVLVGADKTALSVVDQRLHVVEVTAQFGSYVKFVVKCEDELQATSSSVVMRNAFDIGRGQRRYDMMTSPQWLNVRGM